MKNYPLKIYLKTIKQFDVVVGQEVEIKNAFYDTYQEHLEDVKKSHEAGLVQNDSVDVYELMNDLIAANNENLSPDLIAALQIAFMEIIETEDGGDVFDVYSHRNYMIATDEMFDELREVLNMN